MAIKLDHAVIYAEDHDQAAREFAWVMDLPLGRVAGEGYEFSAVRIHSELAIYFMNRDEGSLEQHMAFHVDGRTFDKMVKRLKKDGMAFGNSPFDTANQRTDHDFMPRGLFWTNRDGCLFEIITDAL
ncbi:hypothetical protein GCM10028778_21590 [Barrientosiimonas marina]|uniref:VOC domain-containing protein n=1 Tax=Lentibacillus kimchii TaxID=1542911 RepID=A0ABW2UX66_9BACI